MSRLFWLGLGVAAGVVINRKVAETARQLTPAGAAANVGDALRELASAVGSFGAEVRAGMSEREDELRELVDERTSRSGTGYRALPPAGSSWSADRALPPVESSWSVDSARTGRAEPGAASRARRARRAGG